MFYSSHVNVLGWGLRSWAIWMLPASAKPWQQNKDTHTHTTLTYTQKGSHMALNGENKTKELNMPRNRTTMET